MMDYFSQREFEYGLQCLKKAIDKYHVEAIYSYGIILICFKNALKEQKLQITPFIYLTNFSKRRTRIINNCHLKTEFFLIICEYTLH